MLATYNVCDQNLTLPLTPNYMQILNTSSNSPVELVYILFFIFFQTFLQKTEW